PLPLPRPVRHAADPPEACPAVARRIPEAPRAAILQAVARFATDGEPRKWPPFEPTPHAPLCGDLLGRGIGGKAQRKARQGVWTEAGPAAPALDLVAHAVERAPAAQAVVHEYARAEAVRQRAREPGAGAELVDVGAIARVPAAEVQLPVSTSSGQRRGEQREQESPEQLSPPRPRWAP